MTEKIQKVKNLHELVQIFNKVDDNNYENKYGFFP